jgi:hypothetical protein
MAVLFDIRGNLQGSSPILLSQTEIEQFFVKPFDYISTRHRLFEEYKRYTHNLAILLEHPFYQWIDGSFTSSQHSPSDIDLVSFIDYKVYQEKEQLINEHFSKWAVAEYYIGLDAFTVNVYPDDHNYSVLFQADRAYWYEWFGYTRYNRSRKRFTKNFIHVNLDQG